jgi:hypothetical protein
MADPPTPTTPRFDIFPPPTSEDDGNLIAMDILHREEEEDDEEWQEHLHKNRTAAGIRVITRLSLLKWLGSKDTSSLSAD